MAANNERAWPRGDFAFSRGLAAWPRPCGKTEPPSACGIFHFAIWWPACPGREGRFQPSHSIPMADHWQSPRDARAGSASVVTLWQIDSARKLHTITAGSEPIRSLTWSGDGKKLAAGTLPLPDRAGSVTVWDAQTGAMLAQRNQLGSILFVAFHPDASRLAIADNHDSPKVHLWDLASGTLLTSPAPEAVSCVGFSPDGTRLVSLGYDGNVHLADARTGDDVLVLRGFGPPIGALGYTPRVAFSPDGCRIVANYAIVGRLNVWESGSPRDPGGQTACGRRGRLALLGPWPSMRRVTPLRPRRPTHVPATSRAMTPPPGSSTRYHSAAAASRPRREMPWPAP